MMPLCAAAIKPSPQLGVAFYTGLAEVAGYPERAVSPKPRRPARVSPPPLSRPALPNRQLNKDPPPADVPTQRRPHTSPPLGRGIVGVTACRPLRPFSPYKLSSCFWTLNRLHSDYEIWGDSLPSNVFAPFG